MSGVSKVTADRTQRILLDLVSKPGNDVCADCKARLPRWASYNLGVFLCMNCASIHRKIGTHVTKVKSVTMDSWSKEQVEVMKSVGNLASNAKFNPNEIRHPPPTNREESERDSELEKFIRNKYEFKRFMGKSSTKSPPSSSVAPPTRARSTPATAVARHPSPPPPTLATRVPAQINQTTSQGFQVSRPFSAFAATSSRSQPAAVPAFLPSATPAITQSHAIPTPRHPVWEDIMSLSGPSVFPMTPPRQPPFASPVATGPYTTSPPAHSFPSRLIQQRADGTAHLPFLANTPTFSQSQPPSMANPFNVSQQPPGFTSQLTSVAFQAPMQGQPPFARPPISQPSFAQPPFAQPSHPPFAPAGQPSFPNSYTTPSSFPQILQQQQQQQFVPSSLPNMQPQEFQQQQPQLVQGGNSFGTWSQQQPGVSGQQPPAFLTQPAGFTAQQ